MRKLFLITATVILLLSCNLFAGGEGSGFGSLSTASTNGMGIGIFGVGAGFANANSIFGSFTYGMSANTDGRLRLALIDANSSNTELAFAADFKYNFVSVGELKNGPFDMALGGFFEYYNYDYGSIIFLGSQYIGSYPITMSNNSTLTPYGRFDVRLEMINYDSPLPNGDDSKSNLEFGFNAGVKWQLTKNIDIFGEFQFDGNDGLFVGLDFGVM